MFGTLTEKFKQLTSKLIGQKTVTEGNIAEAVQEVRQALLDADVNFSVVSQFVEKVKQKAIGDKVLKAVSPGEQFIHVVHEELVELMGKEEAALQLSGEKPAVVMLCGLQGSGKTTTAAKLGLWLKKQQKKVMVAACDLQRPAAVEQLKTLCGSIDVPCFVGGDEKDPVKVARQALREGQEKGIDVLIVDTAGRLHVDEELMRQLREMKEVLAPQEILFVASAHLGQEAAAVARAFDQEMAVTGSVLTMLDGTSRAGAAISIREMTQKPLKFEGVGEKVGELQPFSPRSMADRILGMGDVVNLVRKAKEEFDVAEQEDLEKKLRKGSFTYDDYLKQMRAMKRMGPLKNLLQMIPGMSGLPNLEGSEDEFKRIEAMISSMTEEERQGKKDLVPSRRWRIAKGSGTGVDHVNKLIKRFGQMGTMLKGLSKKSALMNAGSLKGLTDLFK